MQVRDARRPDQVGSIAEPDVAERRHAHQVHGPDYALRWCWVVWQYGTCCWERRAELLILDPADL